MVDRNLLVALVVSALVFGYGLYLLIGLCNSRWPPGRSKVQGPLTVPREIPPHELIPPVLFMLLGIGGFVLLAFLALRGA